MRPSERCRIEEARSMGYRAWVWKADYSVERSDFPGTRLALLDEIIEASIRCKQHSNAVGTLSCRHS